MRANEGEAGGTKAIPMNATVLFGLHMITAGSYDGEVCTEQTGGNYKKIGNKRRPDEGVHPDWQCGTGGRLYAAHSWKRPLKEINYEPIKIKLWLMAFSQKERGRQLGGAI